MVTLDTLKVGQKAVVVKIENKNKALKRRILDMGITKGVVLQIVKFAPLGDPVEVLIRGYMLSIRKEDLGAIYGEIIKGKEKQEEVVR